MYVHDMFCKTLKNYGVSCITGTTTVALAREFDVKAIGTHAHEWFMFHAARYGFKMSNILSLENWVGIYRGDLGIALSDTYSSKIFFVSFDKIYSNLFDVVRYYSGVTIDFAYKAIQHY